MALKGKASDSGTLYAAIEAGQVVTELNRQYKLELQPRQVSFTEQIKKIGKHEVKIIFAPGISAEIVLNIITE